MEKQLWVIRDSAPLKASKTPLIPMDYSPFHKPEALNLQLDITFPQIVRSCVRNISVNSVTLSGNATFTITVFP
jgi:hypothetical protein